MSAKGNLRHPRSAGQKPEVTHQTYSTLLGGRRKKFCARRLERRKSGLASERRISRCGVLARNRIASHHSTSHLRIPPPWLASCWQAAGSQPHPRLFTSNLKNPHQFRSSSNRAARSLAPSLKAKMGQGLTPSLPPSIPFLSHRRRRADCLVVSSAAAPSASVRVKK